MAKAFYVVRDDNNTNGTMFRTKKAVIQYLKKRGLKITHKMLDDASNYFDDVSNTCVTEEYFYEDQN